MKEQYRLKETIVTILADEQKYIDIAKDSIVFHRNELERYISGDPFFQSTLEAYHVSHTVPEVVGRMINAGNALDIGPMSAVAGTISALAVEAMVKAGASFAIVDNGGDIAVINDRPIVMGIYAGESPIKNMGFVMGSRDNITGVCTSSGTVGPSISFGMADASIVFSDNVSLADSAATALGNDTGIGKDAVQESFGVIKDVPGIKGAMVVQGEYMGFWGDVPELTKANVRYDCITKG